MALTTWATNRHRIPLGESRKDDPLAISITRRATSSCSPPQGLNISGRKRLLSVGYLTLTRIVISIRGHPRTVVFGTRPSTRCLDAPASLEEEPSQRGILILGVASSGK